MVIYVLIIVVKSQQTLQQFEMLYGTTKESVTKITGHPRTLLVVTLPESGSLSWELRNVMTSPFLSLILLFYYNYFIIDLTLCKIQIDMAEKFDNLEEHLEKFVENIRQLGIIVSDFQPSSQTGLNQKLNFMITGLQDIEKCRQQIHDINVPLEVFEYIDQGRNPQLYTKECLERALAKNEQVKGKIDTLTKFKSLLISELGKVFPEEMAKYKAIHGDDPPS
ncbi:mediator of RNA polymerase II transcription subunit 10-like [Xyrauchen texanus]|uniref:mediator of RNA polymerase II transcription subunit 10-like n=1 Tax=Xyrauchen texanus TaxID=154827 RepID=UPI002242A695|nr:mediator of RNA polymerase II transcription subunit 10-like [Xyrauchen texanus]